MKKEQNLNQWVEMLHSIYGGTQNYSKTNFEICTHLLEVSGAFGKYLLKKKDPSKALPFLPKIFAWSAALLKGTKGASANAEEMLLVKFPSACPYCGGTPCGCWNKTKPPIDEAAVRALRFGPGANQKTSLNDLQLMFKRIYEPSWRLGSGSIDDQFTALRVLHSRLIEELSELAEALRFHHLEPSLFDNEFSDVIAWWFALVSSLHHVLPGQQPILAEDLMWQAYPGYCKVCLGTRCDCRAGPVRELLSRPALGQLSFMDEKTQASNRKKFNLDIGQAESGDLPLPPGPISCSVVEVCDYKSLPQATAEELLIRVANGIRQKLRTRDRLYRFDDSEFIILHPDFSEQEAFGFLSRVETALADEKRVSYQAADGTAREVQPRIRAGIASCRESTQLRATILVARSKLGDTK